MIASKAGACSLPFYPQAFILQVNLKVILSSPLRKKGSPAEIGPHLSTNLRNKNDLVHARPVFFLNLFLHLFCFCSIINGIFPAFPFLGIHC